MEIKIGSHVSMGGKEMLLGSAKEAKSYGANVFMAYTGAPQNTKRKDVSELRIDDAWNYMKENDISEIIIHAPYIINLGNTVKPETYDIAEQFLATELERTAAIGSKVMVLHPGSHVGAGVEAGVKQIINGLNNVLTADSKVYVALETMAGKGSEIGRSFEELAMIYEGVKHNDKLRVCFDTCHVNDAGYNLVEDLSGVLTQFDKIIGTDQIAVFHINDSKNPLGAAKDRHENVGFGHIGYDTLRQIVYMDDFTDVPKILETPYIKHPTDAKRAFAPYKHEIEMIKSGVFNPQMQDIILKENGIE
ncbi:MAG: deoxyribonuclease IV [Lachnospiraceae bacterium]|nr:deoxyribonuclease IV [Lachnospiraceae bacterium]